MKKRFLHYNIKEKYFKVLVEVLDGDENVYEVLLYEDCLKWKKGEKIIVPRSIIRER